MLRQPELPREEESRPEPEEPLQIEQRDDGTVQLEGQELFLLLGIRFSESVFLSPEQLAEFSAPYVNRMINLSQLASLVEQINQYYEQQGLMTARAVIPPQRIRDGIVDIQLIEGRLGTVELRGHDFTRDDYLTNRLPLSKGEVLDLRQLREQLDWFNRTGELRARAALRPGAQFGESDVVFIIDEPLQQRVQLFANNHGVESTGRYQAGLYWMYYGLLGRDDRASVYGTVAQGSYNLRTDYSVVVDERGGRLGVALFLGRIRLIDGPFKELNVTGGSQGWQLQYEYPWKRSSELRLDGIARIGQLNSFSEIDGVTVSDTDIQRFTASLRGRYTGKAMWGFEQNVSAASSEIAQGLSQNYLTYPGSLTYLLRSNTLYWVSALGWQYTRENSLPSADLFQLGGMGSVRGYPNGVVSGPRGYYANFELHWPVTPKYSGLVFFDGGSVYGESPARESVTGFGLGLNAVLDNRWRAEAVLARPTRQVTPDQDKYRIDVQLVYDFPGH